VRNPGTAIALLAVLVLGCGTSPAPSPSPSPAGSPEATGTPRASATASDDGSPRELTRSSDPLPPGTYTRASFLPRITLELGGGWFAGTLSDGFFDVQRDRNTPDVIAVQFGRVDGVVGAEGRNVEATSAGDAARAIAENPGLEVLGESESRLGGLTGSNLELENTTGSHTGILDVSVGRLGIDSGRRLWISLFDTPDGLLAVMVGGSIAQWARALGLAEPVLESIVIGGTVDRASAAPS